MTDLSKMSRFVVACVALASSSACRGTTRPEETAAQSMRPAALEAAH